MRCGRQLRKKKTTNNNLTNKLEIELQGGMFKIEPT